VTPEDIAKLHYVQVGIAGQADSSFVRVYALEDSGSQIAVINKRLIGSLRDVDAIGSIKIRGIVGEAVKCELIRLHICLLDADPPDGEFARRSMVVTCAVLENANDSLLLPSEVIDRLRSLTGGDSSESGGESDADNDGDDDQIDREFRDGNPDADSHEEGDSDNGDGVEVNVVTRSGRDTDTSTRVKTTDNNPEVSIDQTATSPAVVASDAGHPTIENGSDDQDCVNADNPADSKNIDSDTSDATRTSLIAEQKEDPTLCASWKLWERGKGNFEVVNGVLLHRDKILGHDVKQLVLPQGRRAKVLELGHGLCGAHMAWRNTANRIRLSFWWPTVRADVIQWVSKCEVCQRKARVTCWDRVPIKPIPRAEVPFSHWFMDVGGPLSSEKLSYNYFLVLCCSMSRYPMAFALRTVTSTSIVNSLISVFQLFGCASYISCDNATCNAALLTQECLRRMGCSPRFITPGHSPADGLAERLVGTTKSLIAKVAADHPRTWHKHLGYVMWALREVPNETTHVPPALLAFGRVPHGPLAILKETWCGEREFPPGLGKGPLEYLKELHENLRIAQQYAESHTQRAQQRYAEHYNRRSRDKHFTLGDEVLILKPDSTASRVFSKWKGPAKVVAVKSPYSYSVELDGARYHMHANYLRRYNVQADEVQYNSSAFGGDTAVVSMVKLKPDEDDDICTDLCDALRFEESFAVRTCAIIHDEDEDFGAVQTVATSRNKRDTGQVTDLLPSQRIDPAAISHLDAVQQRQLFGVIDRYPDVFRDEPGLCTLVRHEIPLTSEFRPRRLRAYRIPERLKPEVEKQLKELHDQGFIRRSASPMASPLVCVLKGPGGRDGVRLAVDYRYLNRYTIPDAFPVPDIQEVIQRIGRARYISVFDASAGYWQTPIKSEDQWKSGFVCGDELWEWTRTPFGMRSSGNTFCRAVQQVLRPIKNFAASYIDDMAVHSETWKSHIRHLDTFLQTVRRAGMTLKLRKSRFALPEVKFCGQLVGSGTRRADPEKVSAVSNLQVPETKRNVRQIVGFFSYFRENIPNFAEMAKPLTDLTARGVPNKVPWGTREQAAFEALKRALIKATEERLYIVDLSKSFGLLVDASDHTVAGALLQTGIDGIEHPIAFFSQKLNDTQRRWATVEKEAFSALSALRKYRHWIFGTKVVVYSDHNPLTFLTESAPKSAKLMRWALALQEFDVEFRYRAGKTHIVPDVLTRLVD
jgi:hypothetical protein